MRLLVGMMDGHFHATRVDTFERLKKCLLDDAKYHAERDGWFCETVYKPIERCTSDQELIDLINNELEDYLIDYEIISPGRELFVNLYDPLPDQDDNPNS